MEPDERLAKAQAIIEGYPSPPKIREGIYTNAGYGRISDTVDVPKRTDFTCGVDFYTTLFHELVNSTGHDRLGRKSLVENDRFGGKVYSEEELVAEMGGAFLSAEADIVPDEHEQSAAYLRSWIDALGETDHRRWVVWAANQAAKAADFILRRKPLEEHSLKPVGA